MRKKTCGNTFLLILRLCKSSLPTKRSRGLDRSCKENRREPQRRGMHFQYSIPRNPPWASFYFCSKTALRVFPTGPLVSPSLAFSLKCFKMESIRKKIQGGDGMIQRSWRILSILLLLTWLLPAALVGAEERKDEWKKAG